MSTRDHINALGRRQHGVVTLRQLIDFGLPERTVRDLARREGWQRAGRGLFYLPGSTPSFDRDVIAALLRVGEPAVASHDTALAIWGLGPSHALPIHVMVPHERGATRAEGIRAHRTKRWDREDLTSRDGVACLGVERTIIEMAAVGPHVARSLIVAAVQRGLTTPDRLVRRARSLRGVPGSRRTQRLALALAEDRVDSEAEAAARQVVRALGLTPHPSPYRVPLPNGRAAYVDIALVDLKIAIEVDGLPYHSSHADLLRDHERQNQLHAAGWIVIRVSWRRLIVDPDGFANELRAIVERRTAELATSRA